MRVKKYVAKSMREALLQIKEELGEDAVILKTSKVQKNIFGLGPDEIEVTAAIDEDAAVPKKPEFPPLHMAAADSGIAGAGSNAGIGTDTGVYGRSRQPVKPEPAMPVRPYVPPRQSPYALPQDKNTGKIGGIDTSADTGRYQRQPFGVKAEQFQAAPIKTDQDELSVIKAGMQELQELVKTVLTGGGMNMIGPGSPSAPPTYSNSGWDAFIRRLTDSEVKPAIAKKLVDSIRGSSPVTEAELEKKLVDALSAQFPTSGPLKLKKDAPLVVAFVGPTGSGKTTTLAKLAAHCCFNKSKKISIITADTYRIAAIEQIRMFADIVSVGLQVVFSPDEIPDALAACDSSDVVFVDTAGRSQRNKEHMEELRLLVDMLRPDETHLVLSATTKDSDLADMVHNYRNIRINRLLFTKLDETARLGNIFNIVSELGIPVSYFTVGQSVPDDIELAQAGKFVKKLMEGRAL